ncbi:hypothetical protein ERJ75_001755100 [Trypanosoma vivax]|nr:hypothetical protein ERJ75_001755100 [Trypanosoma vivax]
MSPVLCLLPPFPCACGGRASVADRNGRSVSAVALGAKCSIRCGRRRLEACEPARAPHCFGLPVTLPVRSRLRSAAVLALRGTRSPATTPERRTAVGAPRGCGTAFLGSSVFCPLLRAVPAFRLHACPSQLKAYHALRLGPLLLPALLSHGIDARRVRRTPPCRHGPDRAQRSTSTRSARHAPRGDTHVEAGCAARPPRGQAADLGASDRVRLHRRAARPPAQESSWPRGPKVVIPLSRAKNKGSEDPLLRATCHGSASTAKKTQRRGQRGHGEAQASSGQRRRDRREQGGDDEKDKNTSTPRPWSSQGRVPRTALPEHERVGPAGAARGQAATDRMRKERSGAVRSPPFFQEA